MQSLQVIESISTKVLDSIRRKRITKRVFIIHKRTSELSNILEKLEDKYPSTKVSLSRLIEEAFLDIVNTEDETTKIFVLAPPESIQKAAKEYPGVFQALISMQIVISSNIYQLKSFINQKIRI